MAIRIDAVVWHRSPPMMIVEIYEEFNGRRNIEIPISEDESGPLLEAVMARWQAYNAELTKQITSADPTFLL